MHGSPSMRSRHQRTLTSCTECRRRKQKCNQTKDRPCSNCARRYPPVACTYLAHESSSSKGSRRPSPSEPLLDSDDCPKMDEQVVRSEPIPRGSTSPYASLSNAPEYSALPLEQSTYPDSPDLYYSSPPHVNYPQSQYAPTPNYYPPTPSRACLGPAQTTTDAQSYSSYYSPVLPTQSSWPAASTGSRDFIGLDAGGSYDTISDLPVETSSPNADLFQSSEPDNP